MLLINGEELKKSTASGEAEKYVLKKIEDIKKMYDGKFPLRFRYPDNKAYKIYQTSDASSQNLTVGSRMPNSRQMKGERDAVIKGERVRVRWCQSQKYDSNMDAYIPVPKLISFSGNLTVRQEDADLAFFMLYLDPNVIGGLKDDNIDAVDKTNEQDKYLLFVDEEKFANDYVSKEKIRAEVVFNVLSNYDEDIIKELAIRHDIRGYKTKSMNNIRELLIKKFDALDSKSGIEDSVWNDVLSFVNSINNEDKDEKETQEFKKLIDECVEEMTIKWKGARHQAWGWYDNKEKVYVGDVICHKGNLGQEECLLAAMRRDPKLVEAMKISLES